jgi:hypothetical protein
MAANLFGRVYMTNMLIQCRNMVHVPLTLCPSRSCELRDRIFQSNFNGFQWYDISRKFNEPGNPLSVITNWSPIIPGRIAYYDEQRVP